MRVVLLTNYKPDRQESMLRFAATLAEGLPRHGCEIEVLSPRPVLGGRNSGSESAQKWLAYGDKYLLFPWTLARRIRRAEPGTLFHICDHSNAVYARFLRTTPHLVTCNDLLAIRAARGEFPTIQIGGTGRILQRAILRGINRAAYATCISEATRGDVLRLSTLAPERVTVTHMGFNHPYKRVNEVAAREIVAALAPEQHRAGLAEGTTQFLFHIGGNQWYKNRLGVLAIYEAMLAQTPPGQRAPLLILAGQKLSAEIAAKLCDQPALGASVVALDAVDNRQVEALYSAAELLLFPSLAEGFGWPIVEAQACGCTVVTTDRAPMPEVGGEGPLYLDPREVEAGNGDGTKSAAARIWALLGEGAESRRQRLAAGAANIARFTTEGMIEKYATLYRSILEAWPHPR